MVDRGRNDDDDDDDGSCKRKNVIMNYAICELNLNSRPRQFLDQFWIYKEPLLYSFRIFCFIAISGLQEMLCSIVLTDSKSNWTILVHDESKKMDNSN